MRYRVIDHVSTLRRRFRNRNGQALVEYALILSFISVLCITCLSMLGAEIRGIYSMIISALAAAGNGF